MKTIGFNQILKYTIPGEGTIKQLLLDDLRRFETWRHDLERQKYPPSVLKQIIDMMVSWSYFRERRVSAFHDRLHKEKIDKITIELLRSKRFKRILRDFSTRRNDMLRRVESFDTQLGGGSLLQWLTERRSKRGEEDEGLKEIHLGDKGIDNLLRDCGFFDRVPIDIHEQRFLTRTGIFVSYSERGDPLSKTDYHEALTRFCREELSGLKVASYDLCKAPGLADLAIWYFCASKYGNVCASTPRCKICPISDSCLYSKFHRK
jgi:hypothetical protein